MKKSYVALGGILACLHLVFLIVSKVIIGSELILVIFLPLISSMYILKTDNKSTLVFVIATFLLCVIFDPISTFIYIVPALLVGTMYGILRKKNVKELSLVYITTLVHALSLIIILISFNFLFIEFDLINLVCATFSATRGNAYLILSLVLFILAFIQSFITHIISDTELERFNFKLKIENKTPKWFLIGIIISLFLLVINFFIYPQVAPLLILFLIIFLVPYLVEGAINIKYKWTTIILIGIFIFIAIYMMGSIDFIYLPLLAMFIFSPLVINI